MIKTFVLILYASGYGYVGAKPHVDTTRHFETVEACEAERAAFVKASMLDHSVTAIATGCMPVQFSPLAKSVKPV